ncbi:DUF7055 domain-containing protein [Roseovarius aestuarii]|nr:hypothetical protein [Roseovarius aestuarii]
MDEFWQFGQSKYLGDGFFDTIWPAKAVGYAVFYKPAHWLGWDAPSSLLLGRLQTALLAFGTLGLLFAIARALGQTRLQALLVIVLVLSFSTFIERIFRTRSEPLALFFATAALYWVVSRDTERRKTILIAGCLSGLSFLATQKAVYFNFSLGLGLGVAALSRGGLIAALHQGAILIAGWGIPVLVYCFVFGGWEAHTIFASLFKGPVEVATNGHSYYAGLETFYVQTVGRNLIPYLLAAFGLAISAYKWRTLIPAQKIALISTSVMIVLIARHNQPWPYVFIMVIPFLTLWAPATLDIMKGHKTGTKLIYMLWAVAILVSFIRNVSYIENDNRAGLEIMRQAESLLDPGETYFDGIGMLSNFRESQRRWLDARQVHIANSDGERSDVMTKLRAAPPHLIIDSYRTQNLSDLLRPLLEHSYVRISPNIQVPGARISNAREVTFNVPLEQEFGLFDKTGKPVQTTLLVEGRPVRVPFLLKPGPIRLRLDEGADWPLFLLPGHKTYSNLHLEMVPVPIFEGVYTF